MPPIVNCFVGRFWLYPSLLASKSAYVRDLWNHGNVMVCTLHAYIIAQRKENHSTAFLREVSPQGVPISDRTFANCVRFPTWGNKGLLELFVMYCIANWSWTRGSRDQFPVSVNCQFLTGNLPARLLAFPHSYLRKLVPSFKYIITGWR